MSQEDNPSPQGDSTSETSPPSEAPNNQVNSAPVTESEKTNNPTAGTLNKEKGAKEKRNRFKEWLHNIKEWLHNIKELPHNINKYITEDNPILDSKELNKKYPPETLASIFWIQKKDRKIILWALLPLFVHTIFYYLKLPQPIEIVRIVIVDLLRITIATTLLIFATKNVCSAYQNRLIIVESFKKYPLQFFTTIIAVGGLFALTIPAVMNVLKLIGDSSALTTAILSITGGFIAVFGLIKSHQKSELEREQLDTQKKKDKRDHTRQIHAERRSRYTKAVEQLADVKAAVRLGGIYTLAGLADEWLADTTLKSKERQKEGQVIINNLCSYIRSPFPYAKELEEYNARKELEDLKTKDSENLSSKEFKRRAFLFKRFEDSTGYNEPANISEIQVKVLEEQEVRRTIFTEMSKRSGTLNTSRKKIVPGPWSKFEFNFSQAPIFYSLSNLTIEKPNFSSSKFYGQADFSNTIFSQDQNFSNAIFEDTPILDNIKFAKALNFSKAIFKREVNFNETIFEYEMKFDGAIFEEDLLILDAEFCQSATFKETVFKGGIHLNRAKFMSAVNFRQSKFKGEVNFNFVLFGEIADFSKAVFSYEKTPSTKETTDHPKLPSIIGGVKFYGANFVKEAIFKKTRFENGANFSGASFGKSLDFTDTYLGSTVFFSSGGKKATVAKFSANTVRDAYKFKQDFFSCKVDLGEATLFGETFEIPLGTVLFDPMSPKYKDGNYSGLSEPAKHPSTMILLKFSSKDINT